MSYKKLANIFDISTLKLFLMERYMLNVYNVPAKEHQVVDRRAADEISVT